MLSVTFWQSFIAKCYLNIIYILFKFALLIIIVIILISINIAYTHVLDFFFNNIFILKPLKLLRKKGCTWQC